RKPAGNRRFSIPVAGSGDSKCRVVVLGIANWATLPVLPDSQSPASRYWTWLRLQSRQYPPPSSGAGRADAGPPARLPFQPRTRRWPRVLAGQHGLEPSLDKLLARWGDGREAGIQRLGDAAVTPCFAPLPGVGLQQDACLHQLPRGVFASVDQTLQPVSLFDVELHDILLYGDLCAGQDSTPS
ncbi:MAG: hypothetical protein QOG25_518, partial [Acetobacteraceae bacterium]|nr:hypothetical protein [Acetobacteraceae bacterium]